MTQYQETRLQTYLKENDLDMTEEIILENLNIAVLAINLTSGQNQDLTGAFEWTLEWYLLNLTGDTPVSNSTEIGMHPCDRNEVAANFPD